MQRRLGRPDHLQGLGRPEDPQKCNGDSGGPTIFKGSDGKERVVGVASFGFDGCREGGFDTRTDVHNNFVRSFLH